MNPGQYQPSGHLNISRIREFNVTLEMDRQLIDRLDDNDKNIKLTCLGRALNFLLITEGCAVLRYTT